MKTIHWVLIVVGVILFFSTCGTYNGLTSSEIEVDNKWSNVETNYQRRTDLYSSVVSTIESSANFEKSTLREVIAARAAATQIKVDINDPATLEKFQAAQGQLQSSFGKLLAVVESYPDLKTTKAFQDFQTQIEGTENRINVARQDFNNEVKVFNNKVKRFPSNIFAGIFGFKAKQFYKSDPGSEKNPDIKFNIK